MHFDSARNRAELLESADYFATALVGATAALAFDLSIWPTVLVEFMVVKPWRSENRGFFRSKTTSLAFLGLILIGILAHYGDFVRGVSGGFDLARKWQSA